MHPDDKLSMWERAVLIVVISVVMIIAAVLYFTETPNPRAPICAAGEIALISDQKWYCVQARKP